MKKVPGVPGVVLEGGEEGLDKQSGEEESDTDSGVQSLAVMRWGEFGNKGKDFAMRVTNHHNTERHTTARAW